MFIQQTYKQEYEVIILVKIYLDSGHGGSDPGAVGNGLKEKYLTLQISTRIKEILSKEYQDVSIKMSRTGDTFPSLSDRTNQANACGGDFFLSIHINSGGGTGFESFIYPSSGTPATSYQSDIHSEVMKLVNYTDRGKKTANFHVLRKSTMPALLTENGFIDSSSDASKLKKASFIEALARGHVNGLVKAFALKKVQEHENIKEKTFHTVVKGDTFYSIAKDYDTTVERLEILNPTIDPTALPIGKKLVVRVIETIYHIVKKGDTVSALAEEYGSSINQIKTWNNLDSNYTIQIGQRLRVK